MSANTKIEWCHATVNHWTVCTPVSPACDHCYAQAMAKRLWGVGWGAGVPRHQFHGAAAALYALDRKAKRLGRPLKVFHNSLSDFFDNEVPVQWRISAMRAIVDTPNLIHLLLTKRIGNAAEMLETAFRAVHEGRQGWAYNVPPNVWLGATICNQPEADRDIHKLLAVPAAKHFLSIEPMLGPVDLQPAYLPCPNSVRTVMDPETGAFECCKQCDYTGTSNEMGIDWVIVGGESGPDARPMHPDWARSLRDQCEAAGVPFLFKQWGNWRPAAWFDGPDADNDVGDDFIDLDRTSHQFVAVDGRTWDTFGGRWMYPPMPLGHWCLMVDEGKKAAGRLIDGREWNGVPA